MQVLPGDGTAGGMALAIVFVLGVANFALHRAVLESGHALARAMARSGRAGAAWVTLGLEFAVLAVALLAVRAEPAWAWAYVFYSLFNALAAWAILTRRI